MKAIGRHLSNRQGYDGWVVTLNGPPIKWTLSTTRDEARALKAELDSRFGEQLSLFPGMMEREVKKVRVRLEIIED